MRKSNSKRDKNANWLNSFCKWHKPNIWRLKDNSSKSKYFCRNSSNKKCSKGLLNKRDFSKWPEKSEDSSNRNIKGKLRDCGKSSSTSIGKLRKNKDSKPKKRNLSTFGGSISSKGKRKDSSDNTLISSKVFYTRTWSKEPNRSQITKTTPIKLSTRQNSNSDHFLFLLLLLWIIWGSKLSCYHDYFRLRVSAEKDTAGLVWIYAAKYPVTIKIIWGNASNQLT